MSISSSRSPAVRRFGLAPALRCVVLLAAMSGVSGSAARAVPASAASEIEIIKLASLIPSGSVWYRMLKEMGAEWRRETAGRVQLRVYPGGVAGDDTDVLRKMRIGQLQAGTVTVSGLSEIDPAFALFEIPMFFDSYPELFHVMKVMGPEFEDRLRDKGYVLVNWVHAGWIRFFTSEPTRSLEQLQELEVFQWAGESRMERLWRRHGFRPVALAGTDIMMGLQTGMFKALPATPVAALSLQWFRLARNMIDLGVAPLVGATLLDERAWSRLSPADQASVLTAARAAGASLRNEIPGLDAAAVHEMEERGLELHGVLGTAEEGIWKNAAVAFAEDMRAEFVPADVFDRAVSLRDAYRTEHEKRGTD